MEHMFKKIPQQKVSDRVFEQIRDLITTGKLNPGDQLPPERELTTLFNVSRSSVREAILKLECLGFIEQRHGEGTFVKSATEAPLMTAAGEFLKQKKFVTDLFEIRSVLESWAAAAAAQHATAREIEKMKTCLAELAQASAHKKSSKELNRSLHTLIAQSTHNLFFVHIMDTISDWIRQLTENIHTQLSNHPEMIHEFLAQHAKIVAAIENRDSACAYKCMQTHLAYTRDMLAPADASDG